MNIGLPRPESPFVEEEVNYTSARKQECGVATVKKTKKIQKEKKFFKQSLSLACLFKNLRGALVAFFLRKNNPS